MTICTPEKLGADPANIQWRVVRGDSASIVIEFLEDDEVTYFDTSTWTFKATAYDPKTDVLDELEVIPGTGTARIEIHPSVSELWGTGYSSVVSELMFDLQVTIPASPISTVWTPVIGTIYALGNVSPGGL